MSEQLVADTKISPNYAIPHSIIRIISSLSDCSNGNSSHYRKFFLILFVWSCKILARCKLWATNTWVVGTTNNRKSKIKTSSLIFHKIALIVIPLFISIPTIYKKCNKLNTKHLTVLNWLMDTMGTGMISNNCLSRKKCLSTTKLCLPK